MLLFAAALLFSVGAAAEEPDPDDEERVRGILEGIRKSAQEG